jgi:hypothetical protein
MLGILLEENEDRCLNFDHIGWRLVAKFREAYFVRRTDQL